MTVLGNFDDQFDGIAHFFAGLGNGYLNAFRQETVQQSPPVARRGPGLCDRLNVHEMIVKRAATGFQMGEEDTHGHVELLTGEDVRGNAFGTDHRNQDALHFFQAGSRMQTGDIGIEPLGVCNVEG